VQPGTRWRSVGANRLDGFANHHTCGVRTDGSAWCWGEGASGQLGSRTSWWLVPTPVVD
jgi:alpha-tubulin suppressor-like RCC1 family protein